MIKILTAATVAATLMTGVAFAQTAAANKAMPATATQFLATKVTGQAVYDKAENKIGSIDDLVVSRDGTVKEAVVGVGGFLGVGEKSVAVPFTEIKMMTRDGKDWLVLDRSKDQLKAAPAVDLKAFKG